MRRQELPGFRSDRSGGPGDQFFASRRLHLDLLRRSTVCCAAGTALRAVVQLSLAPSAIQSWSSFSSSEFQNGGPLSGIRDPNGGASSSLRYMMLSHG